MDEDDRVKWLASLRKSSDSARLSVKMAIAQSKLEDTMSWSRVMVSLVGREVLAGPERREAEQLIREMDSKIEALSSGEKADGEQSRGRLEASYLSSPWTTAEEKPTTQRHFTVRQVVVEKKRTRQVEESAPVSVVRAVRPMPDMEKSTEIMKKFQTSRRKIVRLEGDGEEDQPKKKKLSLQEVFGDKLNLVDDKRREILQAFLEKRPKPTEADCDIHRIKIHEETTTEGESSQPKKTKVTLYAVLDWEKYSYQKTRKKKTTSA